MGQRPCGRLPLSNSKVLREARRTEEGSQLLCAAFRATRAGIQIDIPDWRSKESGKRVGLAKGRCLTPASTEARDPSFDMILECHTRSVTRTLSVRNAMKVERIFTSQMPGGPQIEHESVRVVAGSGIEGDRYFGLHNEPGQNLTLIEIEEIEAFLFEQGRTDHISITHRNLLTRGVRLNELVGVEFTIGEVSLRGVELCEPCLGLGTALSSQTLSPAAAVKRFVRRGGLRADVLSSGVIERGATITLPPNPSVNGD